MYRALRRQLAKTVLGRVFRKLRWNYGLFSSQSDERDILGRLIKTQDPPMTFVEIGFHPFEFNCIAMAHKGSGLLIDMHEPFVTLAREVFPEQLEAVHKFLRLDNLGFIRTKFSRLGALSIDVDGNDYWFLDALIETKPTIIIAEYNSSLGLRPIAVPYDADFDRHAKHRSGWYHGASITAFCKLAAKHGYGLAAVSDGGQNLFFTREGSLDPASCWKPNVLREKWSGKTASEQWEAIADMPYVTIS